MGLVMALAACSTSKPIVSTSLSETAPFELELNSVPFFPQEKYQCGPAALATVLTESGVPVTPRKLVPAVYLPQRRGSLQVELIAASRRYGRIPYVIDPELDSLIRWLQAGRPVVVLQNLALDSYPVWHYAVVIGYSAHDDAFLLRSGKVERLALPASRFLRTWSRGGRWGLVVLKPGEIPAPVDRDTYLRATADFENVAGGKAALPAYHAGVRRWPESLVARFGLANALHAAGDDAAAESAYRMLLAAHSGYLPALNNLAMILADRGCIEAALGTIDQAIQLGGADQTLGTALRETREEIRSAARRPSAVSRCDGEPAGAPRGRAPEESARPPAAPARRQAGET